MTLKTINQTTFETDNSSSFHFGVEETLSYTNMSSNFFSYFVGFGIKSQEQIDEEIARLTELWHEERKGMSSPRDIFSCPAYLKILKYDTAALSFIYKDLIKNYELPDNWFHALKQIEKIDPILPDHHGKRSLMANDWLKWAKDNGRI
jgi:hypothetical protein